MLPVRASLVEHKLDKATGKWVPTPGEGGEPSIQDWQRAGPVNKKVKLAAMEFAGRVFEEREIISSTEQRRLRMYQNYGYRTANHELRSETPDFERLADPHGYDRKTTVGTLVKSLDSAIGKSVVNEDIVVFRGTNIKRDVLIGLKPGDEISDKAYVSTSLIESVTRDFGSDTMEIRIPEGSQALSMDASGIFGSKGMYGPANWQVSEGEVLLPRNSRFRVVEVSHNVTPPPGEDAERWLRIGMGRMRIVLEYLGPRKETATAETETLGSVGDRFAGKFTWSSGEVEIQRKRGVLVEHKLDKATGKWVPTPGEGGEPSGPRTDDEGRAGQEIPEGPGAPPGEPVSGHPIGKHVAPATGPATDRYISDGINSGRFTREFGSGLREAVAGSPPSVQAWLEGGLGRPSPFPIIVEVDPEDPSLPPFVKSALRQSEAMTVNGFRITWAKGKIPSPESLTHELTHAAFSSLVRHAPKEVEEGIEGARKIGADMIGVAFSRRWRTKTPPQNEEDYRAWWGARHVRQMASTVKRYIRKGKDDITGAVELELMIPPSDLRHFAARLGHETSKANDQWHTMVVYSALAKKYNARMAPQYEGEELVAYRAGSDPEFAERLFRRLRPLRTSLTEHKLDKATGKWVKTPGEGGVPSEVKIKRVGQPVFDGTRQKTKHKLTKAETGRLGEAITQSLFPRARVLNIKRNNLPLDLIIPPRGRGKPGFAVEVKAGLVSSKNQFWRVTLGSPGKAEQALLDTMTRKEKLAHNKKKYLRAMQRKITRMRKLEREMGVTLQPMTISLIVNPDTRKVDVYRFDGFHRRLSWKKAVRERKNYVGSFQYA